MPRNSEDWTVLGTLVAVPVWTFVILPILDASSEAAGEVIPQCYREHQQLYCFLQDQGSSLGAAATLAAVIAALFLPIWQERRQAKSRNQDLFRALEIEADRLRTLAKDRVALVNSAQGQALRALNERYRALPIFTIGVMREGPGMSGLPSNVSESAASLIASVDKFNSLLETKGPLGLLEVQATQQALQAIIARANTLLQEIEA